MAQRRSAVWYLQPQPGGEGEDATEDLEVKDEATVGGVAVAAVTRPEKRVAAGRNSGRGENRPFCEKGG